MSATAPTSCSTPSAALACASGVVMIWRIVQRTFASTPARSCSSGDARGVDALEPGQEVLEQRLDPAALPGAAELHLQRRLDRAASLVAEDQEERGPEVGAGVLERSGHLGREDVAGQPHDEELAEAGVEEQLRRHARVAAAEDGGVGVLLLRERRPGPPSARWGIAPPRGRSGRCRRGAARAPRRR